MTPKVKQVTEAIEEALLRQRISPSFGRDLSGINPPLDVEALAVAAIRAMREPTEDMMALGFSCAYEHEWTAAIDIALGYGNV